MYIPRQTEDWDQDEFLEDNNYAEQDNYRSLDFEDYGFDRSAVEPSLEEQLNQKLDEIEEEEKQAQERLEEEADLELVSLLEDPVIEELITQLLMEALK